MGMWTCKITPLISLKITQSLCLYFLFAPKTLFSLLFVNFLFLPSAKNDSACIFLSLSLSLSLILPSPFSPHSERPLGQTSRKLASRRAISRPQQCPEIQRRNVQTEKGNPYEDVQLSDADILGTPGRVLFWYLGD